MAEIDPHPDGTASAHAATIELARLIDHPGIVLVSVGRSSRGDPAHAAAPAALRLSLRDVSGPETATSGRSPLPDHARLTALLVDAGISPFTTVALFAETPEDLSAAARAWVTLRWAGLRDVRVLVDASGADIARAAAELPSAVRPEGVHASDFVIDASVVADFDSVEEREGALIDAREPVAFGELAPDGSARHIDGAVNLPSSLVARGGRLRPAAEVLEAYRGVVGAHDSVPPVLSCGSGVSASLLALALATAGVEAPVYIGSWSEWSKIKGRG